MPIIAPNNIVTEIINKSRSDNAYRLNVDLKNLKVWDEDEDIVFRFKLDEFRRNSLINGLDDIGITMQHENDISDFERTRHKHGGVLTN